MMTPEAMPKGAGLICWVFGAIAFWGIALTILVWIGAVTLPHVLRGILLIFAVSFALAIYESRGDVTPMVREAVITMRRLKHFLPFIAVILLAGCTMSQAATKLPPRYESRSELVVKGPRYDANTGDLDLGGIGARSTCHGDCPKYLSYPYNYYDYGGYGYGASRGVYPYGIAPWVCPTCQ